MSNLSWRPWTPDAPLVPISSRSSIHVSFPEVELAERLEEKTRKGEIEDVKALLDEGANPNVVLWGLNSTLLGHCISRKRFEAAQLLLDAGAHPCFPLTHYADFSLMSSASSDMSRNLSQVATPLAKAAETRRWEWVEVMLKQVDIDRKWDLTVIELVEEDLGKIGPSMIYRRAPASAFKGWLQAMDRAEAEVSIKGLAVPFVSCASPSRELLKLFIQRYRDEAPSDPEEAFRNSPAQSIINLSLIEGSAFEVPTLPAALSVEQTKKPLKAVALSALVGVWLQEAQQAGVPEEDQHDVLLDWVEKAVSQGQAKLIEKTLMPALANYPHQDQLLERVMDKALGSTNRSRDVFDFIQRQWGADQVRACLLKLDQGKERVWRRWRTRSVLNQSDLVLAQLLVDSGIPLPQEPGGSFLEECFDQESEGTNVRRFSGEEGGRLVELLIQAGADVDPSNPAGKSGSKLLKDHPEEMSAVAAVFEQIRLENALPKSSEVPKRGPRL